MSGSIVLLSGGKDSRMCMRLATPPIRAIFFDYGQAEDPPEEAELIDLPVLHAYDNGRVEDYYPARNTIFLAHALSIAEVEGQDEIWIGAAPEDLGKYPDCEPKFLRAFEAVACAALERRIRIRSLVG